MGVGRTFNKQPKTRPKKSIGDTKRRVKVHRKRLVALGFTEEEVRTMTAKRVRQLLARPAKLAKNLVKK